MTSTNIIILCAFAFYMLVMIAIGAFYSKSTKNNEDYFLGGRGLGAWTAAISAEASDMSGWLLMGLPGAFYLTGSGDIWIAIGLLIGTILNWLFVSKRLRRYTIKAQNSLTIPSFFDNRFKTKGVIKIVSAIIIAIFFSGIVLPVIVLFTHYEPLGCDLLLCVHRFGILQRRKALRYTLRQR